VFYTVGDFPHPFKRHALDGGNLSMPFGSSRLGVVSEEKSIYVASASGSFTVSSRETAVQPKSVELFLCCASNFPDI
jgi:hypothetical protein